MGAKANLATFAGEPPRELELHYGRNQPGMPLWGVPGNALSNGQPMSHPIQAEVSITRISSGPCDHGSF